MNEWVPLCLQVMDEPLYVIKQIDSILSVAGQSIVNQFKANLLPMPQQVPPIPEDDDTTFDKEMLFRECHMRASFCNSRQQIWHFSNRVQTKYILKMRKYTLFFLFRVI